MRRMKQIQASLPFIYRTLEKNYLYKVKPKLTN